jgi:hypothetical protein
MKSLWWAELKWVTLIVVFNRFALASEMLGGMSTLIFGDFAQLPPVGDTLLYSDKSSSAHTSLSQEGCMVFEHFNQSVTLDTVFHQAGEDNVQIAFRDALMHL